MLQGIGLLIHPLLMVLYVPGDGLRGCICPTFSPSDLYHLWIGLN